MDVGVARSLDVSVRREVEVVAGQLVAERLDQRHAGQQHRDVDLDLGRHRRNALLDPDAAVQVVGDEREDEDHQQRHERPADEERQERKLEDEEAEVLVELAGRCGSGP